MHLPEFPATAGVDTRVDVPLTTALHSFGIVVYRGLTTALCVVVIVKTATS